MKTATSVWPVRIRTSQRSFLVTSAVTMTVKQMTIRAQVTGNVDPGAISPVTVHGGVVQGAVAADVDAGAVAGSVPRDVTVGDVAGDVDPVTIAGGVAADLAAVHGTINVHTGEAGYEAAKGDVNRPDRHLFNRHSDGTGNEERPLRGTTPNRPDGGRCLHSLRT